MSIFYVSLIFSEFSHSTSKKKKKLADKILPQKVRDLVPESQAYMDLLAFERKLDSTIMRKRLDIQVVSMGYEAGHLLPPAPRLRMSGSLPPLPL
jgi:hypothetical protein